MNDKTAGPFGGSASASKRACQIEPDHTTLVIIIIIFHLYSAHVHYLPEALYKIIPKTTIIL